MEQIGRAVTGLRNDPGSGGAVKLSSRSEDVQEMLADVEQFSKFLQKGSLIVRKWS